LLPGGGTGSHDAKNRLKKPYFLDCSPHVGGRRLGIMKSIEAAKLAPGRAISKDGVVSFIYPTTQKASS